MKYSVRFIPSAMREWKKLDNAVKSQLRKKLKERQDNPIVPGDRLRNFKDHYKIKLRSSGYRLVYEVVDDEIYILVITVGKRDTIYDVLGKKRRP